MTSQSNRSSDTGTPSALTEHFRPLGTVRCENIPAFRSQLARDYACLLDFDSEVDNWSCMPIKLVHGDQVHLPDFVVNRDGLLHAVDVCDASSSPPCWVSGAAVETGYAYLQVTSDHVPMNFRLQNVHDLLRYARWTCPLGDRIRILAALDECGSLTLSECIPAFQETRPVAGLASLVLHRHLQLDLDDALIGPETLVRRYTK